MCKRFRCRQRGHLEKSRSVIVSLALIRLKATIESRCVFFGYWIGYFNCYMFRVPSAGCVFDVETLTLQFPPICHLTPAGAAYEPDLLSMRHRRFTYVPLLNSHLLTYWPAFTTVVHHHDLLNRSSTAWFEAGFCTPTPRGLPSSLTTALKANSVCCFQQHHTSLESQESPC